jgi:hypothetical protein
MDYDKMPLVLTPRDVLEAFGWPECRMNQVYRLFRSKKFPSERVGNKHIIPKPRFLAWLGAAENAQAS